MPAAAAAAACITLLPLARAAMLLLLEAAPSVALASSVHVTCARQFIPLQVILVPSEALDAAASST